MWLPPRTGLNIGKVSGGLLYDASLVERDSAWRYALRTAIVMKIYADEGTIVGIARECKVDPDTVAKYHRIVRKWLSGAPAWREQPATEGIETVAWRDAETVLQNLGIVGDT